MIMKIFSIYDSKIEAHNTPFFMSTIGQATRAFTDETNNTQSLLHKHPEDYTLFELGEFDDQNATFAMHPTPKSIGLALDFANRGQAV